MSKEGRISEWIPKDGFQELSGKNCTITLEPRNWYCDRGNFVAKIYPIGLFAREIDDQDGFPRYYFDETRAKLEIEAWLDKRGQRVIMHPDIQKARQHYDTLPPNVKERATAQHLRLAMKPKIPKGWKLLKPGTQIRDGDMFNGKSNGWMGSSGACNGKVRSGALRYIRKVKP